MKKTKKYIYQSYRLNIARILKQCEKNKEEKPFKGSTIVNILLAIFLLCIGVMQFCITKEQKLITQNQMRISEEQLKLTETLAHVNIKPLIDCHLIFPKSNTKKSPFIIIINKGLIKVKMLTVDGYAMPFDKTGKAGPSLRRYSFPGHLFYCEEMKPFDFKEVSVLKPPLPHQRPKDIAKIFYVFELTYRREADLEKFRNIVAFELKETEKVKIKRIDNLQEHPYYVEMCRSIELQKQVSPNENIEEMIKW